MKNSFSTDIYGIESIQSHLGSHQNEMKSEFPDTKKGPIKPY